MNTLYVVYCKADGCEECSSEVRVLGVVTSTDDAQEMERQHSEATRELNDHLHYCSTNYEAVEPMGGGVWVGNRPSSRLGDYWERFQAKW